METWIAAGDETGDWDIVNGRFGGNFNGLAWVLGSLSLWEHALQQRIGAHTALDVFSTPIANRLTAGPMRPASSGKYHLLDVWKQFRFGGVDAINLDVEQLDPALELVRRDARWLLRDSGLGVLVVGGNAGDAHVAGLGRSGDGLRERARAFSALLGVVLPFLPGEDNLHLLVEGRTESRLADMAQTNQFAVPSYDGKRMLEPFRDFAGRLVEDLQRMAGQARQTVRDDPVLERFSCKGRKGLGGYFSKLRRHSILGANPERTVAAMNGLADLAAALAPRPPDSSNCHLVVPAGYSPNFWSANYRELRHVLQS